MVGQFVSLLLGQTANQIDFGLEQALIPVSLWDRGGANQFYVNGRLTVDGKAVAGARIGLNTYTLPTPTADDGSFSLQGDRTVLSRLRLHVADAGDATVDGSAIATTDADALARQETVIETAFPISLDGHPSVAPGATISGRITFSESDSPGPRVVLWGYELSGVVQDESGAPLAQANVSISDDEGETWAVSGQTGDDGAYTLRFYPGSGAAYSVRVSTGATLLESAESVPFGGDTSARLDLVAMTSMGMVTGTGPDGGFDVTDVPGAEYVGYLVGVAVDDVPLDAALTWPDDNGTFTVTLPDQLPDGDLAFFQTRLRFFTAEPIAPGGPVPADVIPSPLDDLSPRNLPPVLTGS